MSPMKGYGHLSNAIYAVDHFMLVMQLGDKKIIVMLILNLQR